MKKVLALILFCSSLSGISQENHAAVNMISLLEKTQDQIIELTREFDQKQLAWRLAEGIRSTGETVMHVAASYYYIAMGLG